MTNLAPITLISFMFLTFILIILTIKLAHPVLIIMMMLLYSITLSMNLSTWKSSFIYSMLFFLIMISGLLIIFLYFSSLISNEKSQASPLMTSINLLIILIMFMLPSLFTSAHYFMQPHYFGSPAMDINPMVPLIQNYKSISMMYSLPLSYLTLISMAYLLVALMLIIKITTPKIKSMRKML